jgi:hypothetical protein
VYIPPELPPEPDVPNLECTGSLSWNNIKTGENVTGSFKVQNIGDAESLLNWAVNISFIDWGTWAFSPEFGVNLTPEDGEITVEVLVKAPDEKNSEFEGYIKVENLGNFSDFGLIPIYLKTPRGKSQPNTFFMSLFKRFPCIFPLLQRLLF